MPVSVLGRKAKDKITGFTGTITGYVEYLTGCNQALVVPKCTKDGSTRDAQWFDIQRLNVDMGRKPISFDNGPAPGFDKAPPIR